MRGFVVSEVEGQLEVGVRDVTAARRDDGDLLIRVDWSGINWKDALVASAQSRARRVASLVGGIDAAGTIEASSDDALPVGTRVEAHGGELGVARDGGFAEYVYAPSEVITALPDSITTRQAMIIGTAGVTAMQSVLALQDHGLGEGAEVLVTGATGGVGSVAVALLASLGYRPVASTGSPDESDWLLARGAVRVVGRSEIADRPERVLGTERWDAAVDCVGGSTLQEVLRSLRYGGAVAASGLVAGTDLATTVYPFITRAVSLIGIDSVLASPATRARSWAALAQLLARVDTEALVDRVVTLDDIADALERVRRGETRGRILVDPTPG